MDNRASYRRFDPSERVFPNVASGGELSHHSKEDIRPSGLERQRNRRPREVVIPRILFGNGQRLRCVIGEVGVFQDGPRFLRFLAMREEVVVDIFGGPPWTSALWSPRFLTIRAFSDLIPGRNVDSLSFGIGDLGRLRDGGFFTGGPSF